MKLPDFLLAAVTGQLAVRGEASGDEPEGLERIRLAAGDTLCYQGEAGDSMYIVGQGRLRCFVRVPGGREQAIGELRRGDIVGELSLLTGQIRTASVRAIRDSELWRVSKGVFFDAVITQPHVMLPFVHRVIARLQSNVSAPYDAGPAPVSAVAVVPIGKSVPLSDFARRLEKAFVRQNSTMRLTSASCDQALWPGAAQTPWHHDKNPELVAWLNQQEERWPFVIYETDATWSAWTSRCLRQADRILLVADAEDDPARCELEVEWENERTRKSSAVTDLVLLHRGKRGPTAGTRRWLDGRDCAAHYHVWTESQADIESVVRRVTGSANSLVLGGGGARCFAQIGAIRAIDEAGIPIDMIGGASMGAFIGAQRAMGWDAAAIQRHTKDYWVHGRWKDYAIPYLALLSGQKFKKLIKALYGDAQLEDLPTTFFCVSTNVTRAESMVHRRGPLWRWLCASIAVPGVAPPLFDEGCLLVDGAVLNNLPVDVMRGLCAGRVIAVDVSPFQDLKVDPDYNEPPAASRILWNRISPFADRLKLPSLGEILARVTSLPSVQAVETLKAQASLYLHPPVDDYSIIDFKRIDELVEIGYRHAIQALEEWDKRPERAPAPVDSAAG